MSANFDGEEYDKKVGGVELPSSIHISSLNDINSLSAYDGVHVSTDKERVILQYNKDKHIKIYFDETEYKNFNVLMQLPRGDIYIKPGTSFEDSDISFHVSKIHAGNHLTIIDSNFFASSSFYGQLNMGDNFGFYSSDKNHYLMLMSKEVNIGSNSHVRSERFRIGSWQDGNESTVKIGSNTVIDTESYENQATLYANKTVDIKFPEGNFNQSGTRYFHDQPDANITTTGKPSILNKIINFFSKQ